MVSWRPHSRRPRPVLQGGAVWRSVTFPLEHTACPAGEQRTGAAPSKRPPYNRGLVRGQAWISLGWMNHYKSTNKQTKKKNSGGLCFVIVGESKVCFYLIYVAVHPPGPPPARLNQIFWKENMDRVGMLFCLKIKICWCKIIESCCLKTSSFSSSFSSSSCLGQLQAVPGCFPKHGARTLDYRQ